MKQNNNPSQQFQQLDSQALPTKNSIQRELDRQQLMELTLRHRLLQKQRQNVKNLTLHQLLEKTRKKELVEPPSPTIKHVIQEHANILRNAGFQNDVEQLSEKHMQMMLENDKRNAIIRRQMRQAPIFSQIKRGKLGMDSVFILFAMIGSIALPFIFYHKFKANKETIIKSRKYSPEVIENLSDDSAIDIDSVSEQSIHYDNPVRRMEFEKKFIEAQKLSALRRDLDL